MKAAIHITNLVKKYGNTTAVDGLNLSIHPGELFTLLGVNGAGKTTTIKMLTCLTAPTSGDAALFGQSVVSAPHLVKGKIGVSPQETAVAAGLSTLENLEFLARIHGYDKRAAQGKAQEMLTAFHLEAVAKCKARTLSGGYQRRLSIAMALISDPQILFLDEPTLGLDVVVRRELWSIIKGLKGKTTILLTTHYMEEAEALSDRIGVMAEGRLKAEGTAQDLMDRTKTKSVEEAFVALASKGVA